MDSPGIFPMITTEFLTNVSPGILPKAAQEMIPIIPLKCFKNSSGIFPRIPPVNVLKVAKRTLSQICPQILPKIYPSPDMFEDLFWGIFGEVSFPFLNEFPE